MDFLKLRGKTVLVMGVANRKSVAWHIAKSLRECEANVIFSVRSERRAETVKKLAGEDASVYLCDVEHPEQIVALREQLERDEVKLDGLVHSIAFADYDESGVKPFHETTRQQFLRTIDISCFSFIAICNALKERFQPDASVITISISTTRMASENYGFMAPVKAALDSSLAFLSKSFSKFSQVRFNAVAPSLLKTSASAGIPGYVDAYLFAEQAIPRKQAVTTQEAADVGVFLLSPRSSGIVAQSIVVDAGMAINYFDAEIVRRVVENS